MSKSLCTNTHLQFGSNLWTEAYDLHKKITSTMINIDKYAVFMSNAEKMQILCLTPKTSNIV